MKIDNQKNDLKKKPTFRLKAEQIVENSFVRAGTVANQQTHLFIIIDQKGTVIVANKLFYSFFKKKSLEIDGIKFFTIMDEYFSLPELKRVFKIMVTDKRSYFQGLEISREIPKLGKKTILISGRWLVSDTEMEPNSILLSMEDATGLLSVADLFATELKAKRSS